ncbi:hypothetical protein AB0M02_06725 [Actinoplanes sp. NPDC051861]|uniref:hypothetical protein n=1 Tax=Actinoplanes sp. NPDC051861 TaxID=3155170 RepID=UPI00342C6CA6
MDRFEGRCWLDWWANSSTNLAGDEVTVVITTTDTGWDAHGRLVSASEQAHEGMTILCEIDPVFTLRFDDRTSMPVTVHLLEEAGHFVMTE